MNAIECDQLTKRFGRTTAVENLSLAVPAGSIFALLGPNGAGKTTTLKLCLNLLRPSSGTSHVLGTDSTRLGATDFRHIGYVTEEQQLPDWMSVGQLISFCRPLYPQWDDALATRLIAAFDLPTDRAIKKLSRGMRMKAALLSSLAYRPELLVLDEPFGGLDPLTRDDFVQGLLELPGDDRPRTVLVSTHDIDDIERLADHIGFLSESHLLLSEPADALRARFRQIEITAANPITNGFANAPAGWIERRQPAPAVLQFVDAAYDGGRTDADLLARFPGALVQARAMTIRQIFLALARRNRTSTEEAA